jgi:hypothetical protein
MSDGTYKPWCENQRVDANAAFARVTLLQKSNTRPRLAIYAAGRIKNSG